MKNTICFIGEQDGEVERDFKNLLLTFLRAYEHDVRAYLVQIKYDESDLDFNVALCFMLNEKEDLLLLQKATNIFKSMFGNQEHLDIIFLNTDQESAIRKISCPFYTSPNYQIEVADFYLISSEGYGLHEPIACFKRKQLCGENPEGYMLCDIYPPLIGQQYGIDSGWINQLIFVGRHEGYSIFLAQEWPLYVHVAVPLTDKFELDNSVCFNDIKLIAWGELYRSATEAIRNTF